MNVPEIHPAEPLWRKSSYSGGSGECVEVAQDAHGVVWVRDSKDVNGSCLSFPAASWRAFIDAIDEQSAAER